LADNIAKHCFVDIRNFTFSESADAVINSLFSTLNKGQQEVYRIGFVNAARNQSNMNKTKTQQQYQLSADAICGC